MSKSRRAHNSRPSRGKVARPAPRPVSPPVPPVTIPTLSPRHYAIAAVLVLLILSMSGYLAWIDYNLLVR